MVHISTMGQFRMLYLGAGLSALVTFLCAFFLVPLAQEIALTLLGAGEFKPAPFIGWWNGGLSLVAATLVFWLVVSHRKNQVARARRNLIVRART
jgi:hypothetical protein